MHELVSEHSSISEERVSEGDTLNNINCGASTTIVKEPCSYDHS